MVQKSKGEIWIIFLIFFFFAGKISANFMYMPDDVGISPVSVASLQVMPAFLESETAAYYNPASLTLAKGASVSLSYIYFVPVLSASNFSVKNDTVNYGVVTFSFPVTHIIKFGRRIVFGIVTGSDSVFTVPFQYYDSLDNSPQFFRYSRPQMIVAPSFGIKFYKNLRIGLGTSIYVLAKNEMDVETQITGTDLKGTRAEFNSKMRAGVIAGILDYIGNFAFSFVYREGYGYLIKVTNLSDIYAGTAKLTTFTMLLNFYDSFVPDTYEFAALYRMDNFSLGGRFRYKKWHALENLIEENDMIKKEYDLKFKNVFSFALALRQFLGGSRNISLYYSFGYEPSPLVSTYAPRVNYVDSGRLLFGIGAEIYYVNPTYFYKPLKFEIGYQFSNLNRRKFTIEDADQNKTETTIKGYTNALSFMFSVNF